MNRIHENLITAEGLIKRAAAATDELQTAVDLDNALDAVERARESAEQKQSNLADVERASQDAADLARKIRLDRLDPIDPVDPLDQDDLTTAAALAIDDEPLDLTPFIEAYRAGEYGEVHPWDA